MGSRVTYKSSGVDIRKADAFIASIKKDVVSTFSRSVLNRTSAFGCRASGMSLIGGETAEMPGMYREDDYDLAGFAVGVVDKEKIIDGSSIKAGDQLIGLPSNGPHSNGYSLIRKVLSAAELKKY